MATACHCAKSHGLAINYLGGGNERGVSGWRHRHPRSRYRGADVAGSGGPDQQWSVP